jgi:hypothetical protein
MQGSARFEQLQPSAAPEAQGDGTGFNLAKVWSLEEQADNANFVAKEEKKKPRELWCSWLGTLRPTTLDRGGAGICVDAPGTPSRGICAPGAQERKHEHESIFEG